MALIDTINTIVKRTMMCDALVVLIFFVGNMSGARVKQAIANKVNMQSELQRINDAVKSMGGVDVEFELITSITGSLISDALTTGRWVNPTLIGNARIFEAADVPSLEIKNLRPSSMMKCHVSNDDVPIADVYCPLENFTRYADDSIIFNPLQLSVDDVTTPKNYGGDMQNILETLIVPPDGDIDVSTIASDVLSSIENFNANSLYFIELMHLIDQQVGAPVESYTLHFE